MISLFSLPQDELAALLLPLSRVKSKRRAEEAESSDVFEERRRKQARYRAKQIFHWVYQRFVLSWDGMSDLSKDLRVWLKENVEIREPEEVRRQEASDGTRKFLWRMDDAKTVESVLIPAGGQDDADSDVDGGEGGDRLTACISTQVGCAMGCRFCLTAGQGFERNLRAEEIVGQVLAMRKNAVITNIVFMGMGEPLHNLDEVVKASRILLDQDGLNFSKRKITVSTSGLVPGIEALGKQIDISLAISLNATTDEQRSLIMPVNKKWNLQELLAACKRFPLGSHRRITFEYVLLAGFNDSADDAVRLVKLLRGIPSKVNLIPFNPHDGTDFRRPSDERVRAFQKILLDAHLTATVRISRGREISAACGQLRSLDSQA